jgi:5-methylcytosine-specific restriction endonuclease McrBC GTP-binding regulatory subunit McrB
MNTADRSIALMDVALRRRFTFEEVMPDAGVLWQCLDRVGCPEEMKNLVVDIFKEINRRIKFLFDREHQLGHAYFMKAVNASSLREVLLEHVVPMLQEYFYGAWDKICIVLGCPYNDRGKPNRNAKNQENYLLDDSKEKYKHAVIVAEPLEHFAIPGVSKDELQDHLDYRINPDLLDPALEEEKLWRTFLGILVLDGSSFEARLQKLLTLDSAEGDP